MSNLMDRICRSVGAGLVTATAMILVAWLFVSALDAAKCWTGSAWGATAVVCGGLIFVAVSVAAFVNTRRRR